MEHTGSHPPTLSGDPDLDQIILSYLSIEAIATLERDTPHLSTLSHGQRIWHARLYSTLLSTDPLTVPFRHEADYKRMYQILSDTPYYGIDIEEYHEDAIAGRRLGHELTTKINTLLKPLSISLGRAYQRECSHFDPSDWDRDVSEVILAYIRHNLPPFGSSHYLAIEGAFECAINIVAPHLVMGLLRLWYDECHKWKQPGISDTASFIPVDPDGSGYWHPQYVGSLPEYRASYTVRLLEAGLSTICCMDELRHWAYPAYHRRIWGKYGTTIRAIMTDPQMQDIINGTGIMLSRPASFLSIAALHGPEIFELFRGDVYPDLTMNYPLYADIIRSMAIPFIECVGASWLEPIADYFLHMGREYGLYLVDLAPTAEPTLLGQSSPTIYDTRGHLTRIYSNLVKTSTEALYYLDTVEQLWTSGREQQKSLGLATNTIPEWIPACQQILRNDSPPVPELHAWEAICPDNSVLATLMAVALLATTLLTGDEERIDDAFRFMRDLGAVEGKVNDIYYIPDNIYTMAIVYDAHRHEGDVERMSPAPTVARIQYLEVNSRHVHTHIAGVMYEWSLFPTIEGEGPLFPPSLALIRRAAKFMGTVEAVQRRFDCVYDDNNLGPSILRALVAGDDLAAQLYLDMDPDVILSPSARIEIDVVLSGLTPVGAQILSQVLERYAPPIGPHLPLVWDLEVLERLSNRGEVGESDRP